MKHTMMVRVAGLLLLAGCGAAEAVAQENTPAQLWLDLEAVLPKRPLGAGKRGAEVSQNNPVDWAKSLDAMGNVNGRAQQTPVEPYAMFYLASFNFNAGQIDEAQALFEGIKQLFPTHPLCTVKLAPQTASPVDAALKDCAKEADWQKRYPRARPKEPVINPEMTAVFSFPKGDVVFGFYDNVAPATVAQFVKNVKEGVYTGTIVGRVQPDVAVTLGQKESERGRIVPSDPSKGTVPPIPLEFSKALHTRGAISMVRNLGQPESHGILFEVILKPHEQAHDFSRTVFGRVLSGIEILDAISRMGRDQNEYPASTVTLKDARMAGPPPAETKPVK
jgi:cyclophilin family peptidyl-prolyl cis-trans isomerase